MLQTFVFDNNVYFQRNPFTTPSRLVESPNAANIYSGIPDWLYSGKLVYHKKRKNEKLD